MANEISEDSKFNISIKTLAWIIAGVSAVIAGYYGMISNIDSKFMELEIKVQEALELPKPGTGTYTIDMSILKAGKTTKVTDPQSFNVVALNNTVMPADDRESKVNFQRKVSKLQAEMGEYSRKFSEISNKIPYID